MASTSHVKPPIVCRALQRQLSLFSFALFQLSALHNFESAFKEGKNTENNLSVITVSDEIRLPAV
jgi:hypothetical protein